MFYVRKKVVFFSLGFCCLIRPEKCKWSGGAKWKVCLTICIVYLVIVLRSINLECMLSPIFVSSVVFS